MILLVGAALALPLVGRWLASSPPEANSIELRARMPENGGWSLERITVNAGETLTLRLTSDDVVHGFAIGQDERTPVDILPGEWTETTLSFDQPGEYTYYCTRWCGANHWRMRGVIEVSGGGVEQPTAGEQPLFLALGIDLDAPHLAENLPAERPDASRGAQIDGVFPVALQDERYVRASSPAQLWARLSRAEPAADLSDQQVWDLVAFAYSRLPGSGDLAAAGELYRKNCLACHGEQGKGDGVMARGLPAMGDHAGMGREATRPPDFSDPAALLGASPALLEGKIIRGGMGTGMPYWGPIFTDQQIQSLAMYLLSFHMNLENNP